MSQYDSTPPTSSDFPLVSAPCGDTKASEGKRALVNSITGPQLVNPIKTKLIQGFTVDSISTWPPIIWEIIMKVPEETRKRAFRHSTIDRIDNYEKLEWIGDKFISAAVSHVIQENHADKHLAFQNVVFDFCKCHSTMNAICRSLGIDQVIDIDRRGGLSDRVCEDVFEAIAGAIFLELGYETLMVYVEAIYKPVLAVLRRQLEVSGWEEASLLSHAGRRGYATPASMDFLRKLRELCSRHKWTVEIIDPNELENPNPNEECWAQHIVVNGHEKATGRARNKRMARNDAAQQLYERLKDSKLSSEDVEDPPTGRPSEASLTPKAVGIDALDPHVNDHSKDVATKRCLTTGAREDSQERPSKHARLDIDRGLVRLS